MLVGARRRKRPDGARRPSPSDRSRPESTGDFIQRALKTRDYCGAVTFIEFVRDELKRPYTKELALWHGYCLFHSGRYSDALSIYEQLLKAEPDDGVLHLLIASCQYYNCDYDDARHSAERGAAGDLRLRLTLHLARQLRDEQGRCQAHSQLADTLTNQLSLAAIHYMDGHYQEAIRIYETLLTQHPEYAALHVYIAMCQFKLEQYQESNHAVDEYLSENSDSAVALNLKSCAYFRLFNSDIAESQLLQIEKSSSAVYDFVASLTRHNLCIFHNGDDGLRILPPLVHALPEARYNLAILHMRGNSPAEANEVLQDYEPAEAHEFFLRATVLLALGQVNDEALQIEEANSILLEIGELESVKDTVVGRQCLASTKFIIGQYDEALEVLRTVEEIMGDVDEFNYDLGMTFALLSKWQDAERHLLRVQNQQYKKEKYYLTWLCRCHIKNQKPAAAWNLYVEATTVDVSKALLAVISADCFVMAQYYYAMRAYDVLSKSERGQNYTDGLIASAVGVFRGVLTAKEPTSRLTEIMSILGQEPAAANVLQTIQRYALDSGLANQPDPF
jgi:intraflagellar transport protein 56